MIRYLETFFRHKLLAAPIVLALAVSIGYEVAQPKSYESDANVWFDTATPGDPAPLVPDTGTPSSEQPKVVLDELLRTRAFVLAVAQQGGLLDYIAQHPDQQSGLAAVKGIGALVGSSSGQLVDDRAVAQLASSVTTTMAGPQVLGVAVTGPTAAVATKTAQALLDQFSAELLASRKSRAQTAVAYYQSRLQAAQTEVTNADSGLTTYIAAHPESVAPTSTDQVVGALRQSSNLAHQRYDVVLSEYDQANLDLAHVSDNSSFRVIDQPTVSSGPVAFKKRLIYAAVGGLLVGGLITIFGVVALTLLDRSARRALDVEKALGVQVAATIDRFEDRTPVRKGGGSGTTGYPLVVGTD